MICNFGDTEERKRERSILRLKQMIGAFDGGKEKKEMGEGENRGKGGWRKQRAKRFSRGKKRV